MKTFVFFATPLELATWVDEWRQKCELQVAVVSFQPRMEVTVIVEGACLDSVWKPCSDDQPSFKQIWLSVDPLNFSGLTADQISSNSRDSLIIEPPLMSVASLTEGSVGTVSRSSERLKIWKKVTSDLQKQKTKPGMWVLNREMRIKGFYRDKLYSSGTMECVRQGMRLLNLTGLEVFIDEPQITNRSAVT